jgi:hypothetical protein
MPNDESARDAQIEKEIASAPGPDTSRLISARDSQRAGTLLRNGWPRYVRVYDNPTSESSRYVVIFTGRRGAGEYGLLFQGAGGLEIFEGHRPIDINDAGFSPAVGRRHPSLGLHIHVADLPREAQKVLLAEYARRWELPESIVNAVLREEPESQVEVGEEGLAEFKRTGRAGLLREPISRETLESNMQTVEVLARGDDGQMRPTEGYFNLNALDGELVTRPADYNETAAQALCLSRGIRDGKHTVEILNDFTGQILNSPGVQYVIQGLRDLTKGYLGSEYIEAHPLALQRVDELVEGVYQAQSGALTGLLATPEHWLAKVEWPEVHIGVGKVAYCGRENVRVSVGPDRFETMNRVVPFHRPCPECLEGHDYMLSKRGQTLYVSEEDMAERVKEFQLFNEARTRFMFQRQGDTLLLLEGEQELARIDLALDNDDSQEAQQAYELALLKQYRAYRDKLAKLFYFIGIPYPIDATKGQWEFGATLVCRICDVNSCVVGSWDSGNDAERPFTKEGHYESQGAAEAAVRAIEADVRKGEPFAYFDRATLKAHVDDRHQGPTPDVSVARSEEEAAIDEILTAGPGESKSAVIGGPMDDKRAEREAWASSWMGFPSNGISFAVYVSDEGYMLCLMDTGQTSSRDGANKAEVAYLLAGPRTNEASDEDIIFEGRDFYPSPMYDPTGPQAAAAFLDFALEQRTWYGEDSPNEPTQRQIEFWAEEAELLGLWKDELDAMQ